MEGHLVSTACLKHTNVGKTYEGKSEEPSQSYAYESRVTHTGKDGDIGERSTGISDVPVICFCGYDACGNLWKRFRSYFTLRMVIWLNSLE